jgi:hypothetical protein
MTHYIIGLDNYRLPMRYGIAKTGHLGLKVKRKTSRFPQVSAGL